MRAAVMFLEVGATDIVYGRGKKLAADERYPGFRFERGSSIHMDQMVYPYEKDKIESKCP